MGIKTLILGESGTGKSTSLRNFKFDEVCYINPAKKPLPFKGKLTSLVGETDIRKMRLFIAQSNKKIIIIDDAQYVMAFQYMHRLKEAGWDKYNDIQSDFFQLIEMADNLPDDVTVYFLSHIETVDGRQKIKTIGKMLDEKITIEGMFTTVLKTHVSDGKYLFLTQNSGNDTVKSPIGMFPTFAIDNDLKYVDEKMRNYYEIGEFKSDEEMKQADESVKNEDIEKVTTGRGKRGKGKTADEQKEEPKEERKSRSRGAAAEEKAIVDPPDQKDAPVEQPTENKRSRKKVEETPKPIEENKGTDLSNTNSNDPTVQPVEPSKRRSRKRVEDTVTIVDGDIPF